MMFDLPWQINVLVIECILSLSIGIVVGVKNWVRVITLPQYLTYMVWDLTLLALLYTGGNFSWQHVLIGGLFLLMIFNNTARFITKKERKEFTDKHVWPLVLISAVIGVVQITLLVTG